MNLDDIDSTEEFPREFGDYTLVGELGRGAMGVVYDAVDRRLDRPVALKVLRTDLPRESATLARFAREARALASVRHPHIVEIYEAGEVRGRPFYAMSRLEGESLQQHAESGRLPGYREFFGRMAMIADALQTLHRAGIVHRDVKPSNILVEPDGRMVLADFGLARSATSGELTQTGVALGTPIYMSPEQALGQRERIDGRTDIYSLGATLYESLAGRPVFAADDTRGMMHKVLTERPRPLREFLPDLPRECEDIVLKALEKRPEDRYATAEEFRRDLAAFEEGRPVVGKPVSPSRRIYRRLRWPAAAILLLLALAFGVFELSRERTAELTLLATPEARVRLDGEDLGTTPLVRELPPGEHQVELRLPGFLPHVRTLRLEAGDRRTVESVLVAEDPDDPATLGLLARSLKLGTPDAVPVRRSSGGAAPETPHRPTQVVMADSRDLEAFLASAPRSLGGPVEIRDGNGLLLLREDGAKWAPADREELTRRLEEAARKRLPLNLRYRTSDDRPVETEVQPMPEDVRLRIQKLADRLCDQDPRVTCHLKAQVYLKHGMYLAAFREAMMLTRKDERSPRSWVLLREAMAGLDLEGTPLWEKAETHLAGLSRERQQQLLSLETPD